MPKPRKYQTADIKDLAATPRRIIGHDPGLGKTMIAVRAMEMRYAAYVDPRFLVICSKTAMQTWANEIALWGRGDSVTLLPDGREARVAALNEFNAGWLIVNRESVRLLWQILFHIGWFGIIHDEAHHARSRPQRRNSANKLVGSQFVAALFKLQAQTQWAISATLTDGDPRDAWPTLHWLKPKQFRGFWKWALAYCEFVEDGYSMYGTYKQPKNLDEMHAELAPLMLRHTKAEVAPDLPPVIEQRIEIDLSEVERKHYDAMAETMLTEFEAVGFVAASSTVARDTRLQQITTAIGTFEPSAESTKIAWALDYLDGVPHNQQTVIASHFTQPLQELERRLWAMKWPCAIISGAVIGKQRAKAIDDFQLGKLKVLLISIAAGGESVTLSAADTMIVLDQTYSSIEDEQLINRVHRNDAHTRGHKSVTIIRLVARDTIDEDVERLVKSKTAINNQMILSSLQNRTKVLKIAS